MELQWVLIYCLRIADVESKSSASWQCCILFSRDKRQKGNDEKGENNTYTHIHSSYPTLLSFCQIDWMLASCSCSQWLTALVEVIREKGTIRGRKERKVRQAGRRTRRGKERREEGAKAAFMQRENNRGRRLEGGSVMVLADSGRADSSIVWRGKTALCCTIQEPDHSMVSLLVWYCLSSCSSSKVDRGKKLKRAWQRQSDEEEREWKWWNEK